jgi:tetratricopeptide (TPR) repeat protein
MSSETPGTIQVAFFPIGKMIPYSGERSMKLVFLAILSIAPGLAEECPSSEMNPAQAQARFQELDRKAQVEFRHAEFAQASEDFHQATCVAPATIRSYYQLYGIATGAVAAGDFARARHALQEADRLRPDYPLPLAMLVRVNLTSGDMAALKTSLSAVARRFSRDGRLHADLAQDLVHEKQYDLALAEALRAADSGAAGGRAGINLAVLENQVGAFGDAARLASVIEEEVGLPEKVRASGAGIAGLSYESSGQLQEAMRHFKLAIRLAPDQEQAYLALARIYAAQQDNHATVDVLEQARKTRGGSPNVLLALGSALMSTEQYEAASRMLAELIESFPDQLEAYPKLAEAYRNLGEPSRATETLRQLALHKPDDPMLHAVIAQSMLDEEQIDYARVLQELAEAEKASPDDYDIHYLRGKVFLATGRYAQAATALRRAMELRPTEPGAYYQLALAYRKLGQTDLAKEQFARLEFLKGPPDALRARD